MSVVFIMSLFLPQGNQGNKNDVTKSETFQKI